MTLDVWQLLHLNIERDLLRNTFKHEVGGRGWLIWTKLQLYLWQVVFAGGDGLCETLKGKRLWNESAYLILSPLECFGKSFNIMHFPRPGLWPLSAFFIPGIHHNRIENAPLGSWLGQSAGTSGSEWDSIIRPHKNPITVLESGIRLCSWKLGSLGSPDLSDCQRSQDLQTSIKQVGSSSSHLYSSWLQWYCTKFCQTPLVLYVVRISWS